MKIGIFSYWKIAQCENSYYIPATHYAYCEYLAKKGAEITLLCPVENLQETPGGYSKLPSSIHVVRLRGRFSYISAYKNFFPNFRIIHTYVRQLPDVLYIRNPDPLGWLPPVLANRSISSVHSHFVGDSLQATWQSGDPVLHRLVKCIAYLPEYLLTILTAKHLSRKVFCNGEHMRRRLVQVGLHKARSVISSTISRSELTSLRRTRLEARPNPTDKFIYFGYLRKTKGVDVLLTSFSQIKEEYCNSHLTIIGDGDQRTKLQAQANELEIHQHISFLGHIDNRNLLFTELQKNDYFLFCSRSEGSPRVVIEAMAAGLIVISTPVGSLPECFIDGEDIIFSENFTIEKFTEATRRALRLTSSEKKLIREKAWKKIEAHYTKEAFLDRLFTP